MTKKKILKKKRRLKRKMKIATSLKSGFIFFAKSFPCSFIGHTIEEIYLEDEEWCKANTDKDLEVKCKRCGCPARLYWSKKANKLKAYEPNFDAGPTNALFGDISRDHDFSYGNFFQEGYLPPLYDKENYQLIKK